jgi:SpoIID/LytB domain protein
VASGNYFTTFGFCVASVHHAPEGGYYEISAMTMISTEPKIKVGILEHHREVCGTFNGKFTVGDRLTWEGEFHAQVEAGIIKMKNESGNELVWCPEIPCTHSGDATFTLHDVTIGIGFHWERKESQTFQGDLILMIDGDNETITAINEISVEDYLASVISSEMSAEAPAELLKAHAITSRSWLVAMLEREKEKKQLGAPAQRTIRREGELIRWYDREDHALFDVCADDHCQRYQGMTKIISQRAAEAVQATRGVFLVHNNEICDARYYKACGGLTENFENVWEDTPVPYLQCVSDAAQSPPQIQSEADAERWGLSQPEAYCNTTDGKILRQVLPSFDQETTDFFRWSVTYEREELEEIIRSKSGIDFGTLMSLTPIQRGPSGRIVKLKIEGTKQTLVVGKELEIRRWLSKSHLYSSAFVVRAERDDKDIPVRFTLHGAGWGHGVGLCQIGAAVMAMKGFKAEEIMRHYFRGAQLQKFY